MAVRHFEGQSAKPPNSQGGKVTLSPLTSTKPKLWSGETSSKRKSSGFSMPCAIRQSVFSSF